MRELCEKARIHFPARVTVEAFLLWGIVVAWLLVCSIQGRGCRQGDWDYQSRMGLQGSSLLVRVEHLPQLGLELRLWPSQKF